ncbi:UNKNOWN [Stylonychia lemnae]|uniref:Uncharacterized protein n=1 Tax=Stylonychia lemnae TaxID=5949 RepID=A0A078A0B7_STYLE|nr:UNKNOWN [Stylonychia lemnae]|eukprot:CDW74878.1 UNKNOWN [Stylonychia lemnae]
MMSALSNQSILTLSNQQATYQPIRHVMIPQAVACRQVQAPQQYNNLFNYQGSVARPTVFKPIQIIHLQNQQSHQKSSQLHFQIEHQQPSQQKQNIHLKFPQIGSPLTETVNHQISHTNLQIEFPKNQNLFPMSISHQNVQEQQQLLNYQIKLQEKVSQVSTNEASVNSSDSKDAQEQLQQSNTFLSTQEITTSKKSTVSNTSMNRSLTHDEDDKIYDNMSGEELSLQKFIELDEKIFSRKLRKDVILKNLLRDIRKYYSQDLNKKTSYNKRKRTLSQTIYIECIDSYVKQKFDRKLLERLLISHEEMVFILGSLIQPKRMLKIDKLSPERRTEIQQIHKTLYQYRNSYLDEIIQYSAIVYLIAFYFQNNQLNRIKRKASKKIDERAYIVASQKLIMMSPHFERMHTIISLNLGKMIKNSSNLTL